MDQEYLRKIVVDKLDLTDNHYDQLVSKFKIVHLQKNDILIQPGVTCTFIGFVEKGLLRSYFLKETVEYNIDFFMPNSFVSAYTSFLMQVPTHGYIQALSNVSMYIISYENYNQLLKESNDWYRLGKYLSDTFYLIKWRREASLLIDSAAERYKLLLRTYPGIEKHIAQYHLASYLGIKPESLSRIKSLTYVKENR